VKRNPKVARCLRQRRNAAREFSQNSFVVEEILRKRLDQNRDSRTARPPTADKPSFEDQ
jgi:hypothetical protein